MEKTCEFCGAPQPVVYCQADAALLCLSCDSKVHSANALFSRHSRTLLCDSCKQNPSFIRCLDHSMLLCQHCDSRLHNPSTAHKKLMIGSFTGCPSAKHFATIWGFDVNHLDQYSAVESAVSAISTVQTSQHKKCSRQQEQNNCLIMHQILDLKNLQLNEGDKSQTKPFRHKREYAPSSSLQNSSIILNENLEQQCKNKELNRLTNELESLENSNQDLKGEHFPSPITQLDHLSFSSAEDPFWQYKSTIDNNQFWSQNLQDLGMCEELGCLDDFNIPDVDATFHNFEDLLTGDPDLTRALLEDNDPMLSDMEKASMKKFENTLLETKEISVASSISTNKHVDFTKEANLDTTVTYSISRSMESSPHLAKFARSATFSGSRLSAESNGNDFLDSGNSGNLRRHVSSDNVGNLHGVEAEGGEISIRISKEKKKTRL
ncbi:unnamed protein product [Amaranthus hypochondriacus]